MDINRTICNYIAKEWVAKAKSKRAFAIDHNIDEKIVRKISQPKGYNIPIKTLYKICEARGVKLSQLFKSIDEYLKPNLD
ncbi:transcriptional regulator [Flagellimonas nanhaiensis]|uniref:Transcriptional regulator n=1 Tax=Flagellimonas nanhaiensis TaxID=2292706 RepID=A0A371JQE6_9FLAO|nr:transcriptional regulator [Allomuricauda nanhaiensis]